jgi:putative nucleotidyltransferase with HDIG domain
MIRGSLLFENIDDLPSIPTVASMVMGVADDPRSSADDLHAAVMQDPAIAAKILRIANSAYFRRGGEISDLRTAIVHLGFSNVRNLVLGVSVMGLFDHAFAETRFDREQFWRHSVAVATLANAIAETKRHVSPQTAFVVGLLHDIGKLVLDAYLHEEFTYLLELSERENISFFDAEKRTLRANHAAIGGELLEHWNFPTELTAPIRCHHVPMLCPEAYRRYAVIAHVADYLCNREKIGYSGNPNPGKPMNNYIDYIGLSDEALEAMTEWLSMEALANGGLLT